MPFDLTACSDNGIALSPQLVEWSGPVAYRWLSSIAGVFRPFLGFFFKMALPIGTSSSGHFDDLGPWTATSCPGFP